MFLVVSMVALMDKMCCMVAQMDKMCWMTSGPIIQLSTQFKTSKTEVLQTPSAIEVNLGQGVKR